MGKKSKERESAYVYVVDDGWMGEPPKLVKVPVTKTENTVYFPDRCRESNYRSQKEAAYCHFSAEEAIAEKEKELARAEAEANKLRTIIEKVRAEGPVDWTPRR